MFTVGARVMGEWTPGNWYPGRIGRAEPDRAQYYVEFDDGDRAWLTPERIATVLSPGDPPPPVGTRVLGLWSNGHWYPGRIGDVRGSEAFVQFDDGDKAWLPPQKIAPIPTVAPPAGSTDGLVVGARVMGEWSPGAWYPGMIAEAREPEYFVKFDDGDEAWLPPNRIRLGAPPPEVEEYEPPPPPPVASAPARAQVIERQVLVVRCQYCKSLTPADLSRCQNCGAVPL